MHGSAARAADQGAKMTAYAKSAKQVTKAIGCDKLELVRGVGYWYFVFDDVPNGIYETESVMVMYLNSMTIDQWAEIGRAFVKSVTA